MTHRHYTAAEDELLRALYPVTPTPAIAQRLGRPESSVYQRAQKLGLRKDRQYLREQHGPRCREVGMATRIKAGTEPWNKGLHYVAGGRSKETRFKPGSKPHTWRPVGTYGVMDGYLRVKVSDATGTAADWRYVHHLVWEAAHGPIPTGMTVAFRTGKPITDLGQITADKLELLTRAELMARNSVHRHGPEIAGLSQLRGAIKRQINRRQRQEQTHE